MGRPGVPHPAAGLHGHAHRFRDPADDGSVHRITGAGGIEVDDMDPRCAVGLESPGLRHRVVAVVGTAVVVTLVEPHTTAPEQVDRRIQVHQRVLPGAASGTCSPSTPLDQSSARRTKLPSSTRPGAEDFSGWNCVAMTLLRAASAVISAP